MAWYKADSSRIPHVVIMLANRHAFLAMVWVLCCWLNCQGQDTQSGSLVITAPGLETAETTELWYGVLKTPDQHLRTVIQLRKRPDGNWTGDFLSLDQANSKVPISAIEYGAGKLSITCDLTKGNFTGELNADASVAKGTWSQRGNEFPVSFEKVPSIPIPSADEVWRGKLNALVQKLTLQFRIKRQENGEVGEVLFDSVDQKATSFVASMSRDGDQLEFTVPSLSAKFTGTVDSSGKKVSGLWRQGLVPLPMEMSLEEKAILELPSPPRPQTPKLPLPYTTRDAVFENTTEPSAKLAGTLTVPSGEGPFPGVILLSGSGQQDRDSTIADHKWFFVLADYLTRRGIAVLRYDDRGVGDSSGAVESLTTEISARDAQAGLEWLKRQPEIDKNALGAIGLSEGGLLATIVATRDSDIDFAVLLSSPAVLGKRLLLSQSEAISRAAGKSEDEIAAEQQLMELYYSEILMKPSTGSEEESAASWRKVSDAISNAVDQAVGGDNEVAANAKQALESTLKSLNNSWLRYYAQYDPAADLQKLNCQVLAIFGGKDLQVPADENSTVLRQIMAKSAEDTVEIKIIPDLNHLLQPATTGLPTEYGQIEITISPAVLQSIGDWLVQKGYISRK